MSTKAVAYYRRSTDRLEQSIGDQRKAVEAWAAENDCEIVREYIDDGISGALTTKREAFLQLIEDSASGDFEAVLVYDISRFGRTDTDETGYYRHILRQNGVGVVYCMDKLGDDEDMADLVRGNLTWLKHRFLIDLARDTTRGMVTVAEGGWSAGGRAPDGFRRALVGRDGKVVKVLAPGEKKLSDEHKVSLVPGDPAEVAVVRDIFRMWRGDVGAVNVAP